MTDILERMEEALLNTDSLVLDGDEMAMDYLGLSARTLLPEAMKEIKRLRAALAEIKGEEDF